MVVVVPARLASQANREVGEHSPDDSLCEGEGQALQEGGEGKGEGVKEEHAALLPEHWQPLCLQHRFSDIQHALSSPKAAEAKELME